MFSRTTTVLEGKGKLLENILRQPGHSHSPDRSPKAGEDAFLTPEVAALASRAVIGGLSDGGAFAAPGGAGLLGLRTLVGNQAVQSLLSQGSFEPSRGGGCSCGGTCTACSGGEESFAAHADPSPARTCALAAGATTEEEEALPTRQGPGRSCPGEACALEEESEPQRRDSSDRRPHQGDATIVCDGNGGYRPDLRGWAGAPCGIEDCVRRHEQSHADDWAKRYPDGCKNADGTNKLDGTDIPLGGPGYDDFLKKSECDAYTIEIPCEEAALQGASGDCKTQVEGVLKDSKAQQKKYCSGGC
jgi:hypothetical protein